MDRSFNKTSKQKIEEILNECVKGRISRKDDIFQSS